MNSLPSPLKLDHPLSLCRLWSVLPCSNSLHNTCVPMIRWGGKASRIEVALFWEFGKTTPLHPNTSQTNLAPCLSSTLTAAPLIHGGESYMPRFLNTPPPHPPSFLEPGCKARIAAWLYYAWQHQYSVHVMNSAWHIAYLWKLRHETPLDDRCMSIMICSMVVHNLLLSIKELLGSNWCPPRTPSIR